MIIIDLSMYTSMRRSLCRVPGLPHGQVRTIPLWGLPIVAILPEDHLAGCWYDAQNWCPLGIREELIPTMDEVYGNDCMHATLAETRARRTPNVQVAATSIIGWIQSHIGHDGTRWLCASVMFCAFNGSMRWMYAPFEVEVGDGLNRR